MSDPKELIRTYYRKHKRLPTRNELVSMSGGELSQGQAHVILKNTVVTSSKPQKEERKEGLTAFPFLRVAVFFVSAVALIISVYYSFLWLRSYMFAPLALLFASALVIYSATGFSIGQYVQKTAPRMLLYFTACLVLLFSIVCTVAGQINISTENAGTIQNNYIDLEIESIQEQIRQKQIDLEAVQILIKEFDTIEERTAGGGNYYYNTVADRQSIQDALSDLNQELREKIQSQSTNETERGFFAFLDNIEWFQFVLYLIPALFLDLIAPLGLYIAINMKLKKS